MTITTPHQSIASLQSRLHRHVEELGADDQFVYRGSATPICSCQEFSEEEDDDEEEGRRRRCSPSVLSFMVKNLDHVIAHLVKKEELEDAECLLNHMLSLEERGTASGFSVCSKDRRCQSEDYSANLETLQQLTVESKWLWLSERCHDAHISESHTMSIQAGDKVLVEHMKFEKPFHHDDRRASFRGGVLRQEKLMLVWRNLHVLAAKLHLNSPVSALLFVCCLGVHRGPTKLRTNMLEIVLPRVHQLCSDEERRGEPLQTLVIDDQNGDPIVPTTFIDEFGTIPRQNLKPMTIEANIANAASISQMMY